MDGERDRQMTSWGIVMNGYRNRIAAAGAWLLMLPAIAWGDETVATFSTSGCGCCLAWVRHLEEAGFEVTNENLAAADLYAKKMNAGLLPDQTSCHTAFVDGYVIEGHVPAPDIVRLLDERPAAVGLAVPAMPAGSPGMGESDEPYEVLLVTKGGSATTFASYPQREEDLSEIGG